MIKEPKAAEPRWYLKIELENTKKNTVVNVRPYWLNDILFMENIL